MTEVVLVSGHMCTGKSGLARALRREFGYEILKTSALLRHMAERRALSGTRSELRRLGEQLDRETDGRWLFDAVKERAATVGKREGLIVDHVRSEAQLKHFRSQHALQMTHVHLYAPRDELQRRFQKRRATGTIRDAETYSDADPLSDEADVAVFKSDADVRINVARTDTRDNLVRVAARLGLYSPPDVRCVDVLVGGQFGSEGKGHIAAYLASEYDVLVRVGGPNAGHSVSSASGVYTYHHLPSGTKDTDARVLLGPGMTLSVDSLLQEIGECGIGPERLFIDPQAMVIEERDIYAERELVSGIASTGRGGGAAAARRIIGRRPGATRLARDVEALKPYVGEQPDFRGSTVRQLERAYRDGLSVLLEGTQGSGLSLYHGEYPFVTSRDTNVAGCLAEAGISPSRVRRILLVVRPTPIRVGNPDRSRFDAYCVNECLGACELALEKSGELRHETTFEAVAAHARLPESEVVPHERTSTTRRPRRVGWFDWEQFRKACALNAPTDLVLTFADYLSGKNQHARRFEQLDQDTIKFVEELERVAQAPVALINTRFVRDNEERLDRRSVIDRRNWTTSRRT